MIENKLSPEFIEAFCHIRTIHACCEFCGRDHFARDGDFYEGELEGCEQAAVEDPDKNIDHGDRSVGIINIDGKQGVVECPCGTMAKYEEWIWEHRFGIADYLKIRSKNEAQKATRDAKALG